MANDKTPKDNQENTQPQVEETQANPSNEEAEGLGKLYEENKMLVFGVLAVGIAIGVFFFLNAEEDEKENNEIVQSPSVTPYFETPIAEDNDSEQTDSGKLSQKNPFLRKARLKVSLTVLLLESRKLLTRQHFCWQQLEILTMVSSRKHNLYSSNGRLQKDILG